MAHWAEFSVTGFTLFMFMLLTALLLNRLVLLLSIQDAILIGMSYNEGITVHKRETDGGETVDITCSNCGRGPITGVRYMCG